VPVRSKGVVGVRFAPHVTIRRRCGMERRRPDARCGSDDAVIERRTFLGALSGGVVVGAPFATGAQPTRPLPTIGYLGPPRWAGGFLDAFQRGLADLGWAEGRNVHVEYRYNVAIDGNVNRLGELATELVGLKPDVLVVSLTEVALAMKRATTTIPIVMANVTDPVAAGLVSSLAHPEGNVTGVSRQTPELIGKQFQLLKEVLPGITRIGVLLNPSDRLFPALAEIARKTAASLGIQVSVLGPGTTADLESAFSTLRADRAGAVVVGEGGILFLSRAQIADLALKNRLASMSSYREFVEAGSLMSYAASSVANYRRAAFFVDRILKGAKPASLPIEQPTTFELVMNLKTANALGITIPAALRARVDELIQ
jgi:putative ABC transport system substrate-binding protein